MDRHLLSMWKCCEVCPRVNQGCAAKVCECPIVVFGGVIAVYWFPAAWCLRNEGVSSVLLGASNTDQLMENIGAIQVRPQNVCVCEHVCHSAEVHQWFNL